MTQVKNAGAPTFAQQHAEIVRYRSSLESLMVIGRNLLDNPSMEDIQATAFQTLTEGALEPANREGLLDQVDGVTEPAARVELIMQDIVQPQLQTVEQLEEALAAKAEAENLPPFTTRDQMTEVDPDGPSMESLTINLESLVIFSEGLASLRTAASFESATVDVLRPMVLHHLGQAPDIVTGLGLSLEELGETQVLGNLTEAVDKISDVVTQAREAAQQKVDDAMSNTQEMTGNNDPDDLGSALAERMANENPSGIQVAEGTQVSTTNDGDGSDPATQPADTLNGTDAGGADGNAGNADGTGAADADLGDGTQVDGEPVPGADDLGASDGGVPPAEGDDGVVPDDDETFDLGEDYVPEDVDLDLPDDTSGDGTGETAGEEGEGEGAGMSSDTTTEDDEELDDNGEPKKDK